MQGIPESQEKTTGRLEKTMTQEVRKWIDWEQTRGDQGPWPRKIMVSLRFKQDTGLILMIEILKMMSGELNTTQFCVNGWRVRTNLEIVSERNH